MGKTLITEVFLKSFQNSHNILTPGFIFKVLHNPYTKVETFIQLKDKDLLLKSIHQFFVFNFVMHPDIYSQPYKGGSQHPLSLRWSPPGDHWCQSHRSWPCPGGWWGCWRAWRHDGSHQAQPSGSSGLPPPVDKQWKN